MADRPYSCKKRNNWAHIQVRSFYFPLLFYITKKNQFCFRFPCNRWLGKDIEDGSTERLLVAVPFDSYAGAESSSSDVSSFNNGSPAHGFSGSSGSRTRSPSTTRGESSLTNSLTNLAGNLNLNLKGSGSRRKFTESEMQCLIGEAVNNLIKYYLEPLGDRGNLTALLCGEAGLVSCLELILHHGFRSSRIFSRNIFLWDYLRKLAFACHRMNVLHRAFSFPSSSS